MPNIITQETLDPEQGVQNTKSQGPIVDFLLTTTAHGFHKVGESKENRPRRVLWLVVLLLSLSGFAVHIAFLVLRYLSYPVVTQQRQEHVQAQFPAVTLCLNSPFRSSMASVPLNQVLNTNLTFKEIESNVLQNWQNLIRNRSIFDITDQDILLNIPQLAAIFSKYTLFPWAAKTGLFQDVKAAFLACRENQYDVCSYEQNFIEYIDPNRGFCIIHKLNTDKSINDTGLWSTSKKNGSSSNYWLKQLEMVLFQIAPDLASRLRSNKMITSYIEGATAIIHAPGTFPRGDEHVVNIGNQMTVDVLMTRALQDILPNKLCKTDELERLGLLQVDGQSKSFLYSQPLCRELNQQRRLWQKCGCLSESLAIPNDLEFKQNIGDKFCHRMDFNWIDNGGQIPLAAQESLIGRTKCHHNILSQMHTSLEEDRQCVIKCKRYEYKTTSTYVSVPFMYRDGFYYLRTLLEQKLEEANATAKPTEMYETQLAKLISKTSFSETFQKIVVRLSSSLGDEVTQQSGYPIGNLFSDIGGIMGLWIGCSIITILEFSEFSFNFANRLAAKQGVKPSDEYNLSDSRSSSTTSGHQPAKEPETETEIDNMNSQ